MKAVKPVRRKLPAKLEAIAREAHEAAPGYSFEPGLWVIRGAILAARKVK